MMMMNCLCGMVDRQKTFNLISSRDHCQRSSPSQISDTPRFLTQLGPIFFGGGLGNKCSNKRPIEVKCSPQVALRYPNTLKCRPYLLSISNEKNNYLMQYLGFFWAQIGSWSKMKRSEARLAPLIWKILHMG